MDCPSCHEPFEQAHWGLFDDILVERCTGCRKLWLSPHALDRLDDNISANASRLDWVEDPSVDALACPTCVGTYRTASPRLLPVKLASRPEVSCQRCTTCGFFLLDEATLDRVRQATATR